MSLPALARDQRRVCSIWSPSSISGQSKGSCLWPSMSHSAVMTPIPHRAKERVLGRIDTSGPPMMVGQPVPSGPDSSGFRRMIARISYLHLCCLILLGQPGVAWTPKGFVSCPSSPLVASQRPSPDTQRPKAHEAPGVSKRCMTWFFKESVCSACPRLDRQCVLLRSWGYFAHSLNAYGRTGEPCPRCGEPIRRVVVGGRSSHFCPRCQRRR